MTVYMADFGPKKEKVQKLEDEKSTLETKFDKTKKFKSFIS